MTYQDRADIDQLIKDVDELKYLVGDDKKALATIEMVESVANDLKTKYYDKDEIDELISSLTSTP